jgi:hypothetical protein
MATVESEIFAAINSFSRSTYRYISVVAPTGYGKTTLIPFLLAKRVPGRVLVLIPNIHSVNSAYAYLSYITDVANAHDSKLANGQPKPGYKPTTIGFASDSEINYTDKTRIVIATYGHAARLANQSLRTLGRSNLGLLEFTNIIFDEYHNAIMETRSLPGIARYLMEHDRSRIRRLVFMTATVTRQLPGFADITDMSSLKLFKEVKIGQDREVRRTEYYFDPDVPLGAIKSGSSALTKILDAMVATILVSYTKTANRNYPNIKVLPAEARSWLVFLPGHREIEYVKNGLFIQRGIKVVSLTSQTDRRVIETLDRELETDEFLVILATNVVESSITLKTVDVSFDSMLVKVSGFDQEEGYRELNLEYTSQNDSNQRAGRVGRTKHGYVIRMISRANFARLPVEKANSIETGDISKTMLELYSARPEAIGDLVSYMGISRERLVGALDTCVSYGIMKRVNDSYTPIWTEEAIDNLTNYPLDLKSSVILDTWLTHYPNEAYPGVVMACIIGQSVPFFHPKRQSQAELAKAKDYYGVIDGQGTLLEVIRLWFYVMADTYRPTPRGSSKIREYPTLISRAELETLTRDNPIVNLSTLRRLSTSITTCIKVINRVQAVSAKRQLDEVKDKLGRLAPDFLKLINYETRRTPEEPWEILAYYDLDTIQPSKFEKSRVIEGYIKTIREAQEVIHNTRTSVDVKYNDPEPFDPYEEVGRLAGLLEETGMFPVGHVAKNRHSVTIASTATTLNIQTVLDKVQEVIIIDEIKIDNRLFASLVIPTQAEMIRFMTGSEPVKPKPSGQKSDSVKPKPSGQKSDSVKPKPSKVDIFNLRIPLEYILEDSDDEDVL